MKRFTIITLSLCALAIVASSTNFNEVWLVLRAAQVWKLALALVFLLLNLAVAFLRFKASFGVVGLSINTNDALGPFFVGQVANIFPFGVIAQAASRSALLAARGVGSSQVTFLSLLERVIALGSLCIFAAVGVVYVFGALNIDEYNAGTGPAVIWILCGLAITTLIVFLSGKTLIRSSIAEIGRDFNWRALVLLLLYSLLAHALMLTAFLLCLSALTVINDMLPTLGALTIVMFVASLPISFAGWGVRELSAVHALGILGVPDGVSIAVGLSIGGLSLVIIAICVIGAMSIAGKQTRQDEDVVAAAAPATDFSSAFVALTGLTVALLIPFQLRVPVEGGAVLLNMADLGAMATMALLAGDRRTAKMLRAEWFMRPIVLITAALVIGLVFGIWRFGPTNWALMNRGVGWIVIVSYFLVGYMLLRRAEEGVLHKVVTIAKLSVVCSAGLQITVYILWEATKRLPADIYPISVSAFTFNANAYGLLAVFGLVLWMLDEATKPAESEERPDVLSPMVLITSLSFLTSRSAVLMGVVAVIAALLIDRRFRRPIFMAVATAVAVRLALFIAPFALEIALIGIKIAAETVARLMTSGDGAADGGLASLYQSLSKGFSSAVESLPGALREAATKPSSDAERMESINGGLSLFMSSPILGGGLGGFLADRSAKGLSYLVIHSVPVWIIAEMGIVGGGLFGAAAVMIVGWLWRQKRSTISRIGLVAIALFGLGSLVHDFFFQRVFWFTLGLIIMSQMLANQTPSSLLKRMSSSS